jgi:hypothetical protein
MFAHWTIADASDMCKDSEFTQILAKADAISVQIQEFLRAVTGLGGQTIQHALQSDIVQLILRFSAVRSRLTSSDDKTNRGLSESHVNRSRLGRPLQRRPERPGSTGMGY